MVVLSDQPIAMPRPFGGDAPTIVIGERPDGKTGRYIAVQITGVVTSIYQFLELLQVFDSATKNDVIDIFLDTPGGCVFTAQVLLERMNSSKATVTAVASGLVASAGTFLWFFSKHKRVDDWATFMFHGSSHGDYGKSLAILDVSKEMVKYMHKTIRAMITAGILTKEEAAKIFRQKKDLFLPGSIIRSRMLQAVASTESIALRAEGEDGEYPDPSSGKPGESENDRPTDPEGTPDEKAGDDIDGDVTPVDPAAIFRAEGVDVPDEGGATDPVTGDEDEDAQGTDANPDPDTTAKGGKKFKKAKKRRPRSEGETEDPAEVSETDDGDATAAPDPEVAVEPEEATAPDAWLKW